MSDYGYQDAAYDTFGTGPPLDFAAFDPLRVAQPAAGAPVRPASRGWNDLTSTLRRRVPGNLGWSMRYRREMSKLTARGSRIR
jgi:hypothetical protein